ncbi:MAG: NlpC/P60 family protein [Propionicimonas sp.]
MTATAAQYAALAAKQVGKRYILGQPVPHKGGNPGAFDCSGLVIWLNNATGALPQGDDTAAGLYNRSKAVTGTPAVGDLVFLRNNPARSNGIGHVAVITQRLSNGDWRIIEARGKASGVVATTLSYWKTRKHYTGVRRLTGFKLAPAPKPTPTPPATETKFWATTYNCLDPRFGGKAADDAKVIKAAAASVYLLTEAPESVRTAIRKSKTGGTARWKVWERISQAIMFDSTKYSWTTSTKVVFGPTSYHGAVIAILTHKATGRRIQFVALHLPPKSVASEAQRKAYLDKLMGKLDPKLPTIIGGDFNSEAATTWLKPYGFTVTNTPATTDHGRRYDYVAIKGGSITKAEMHDPGSASDHLAVRAHAVITTIPTT